MAAVAALTLSGFGHALEASFGLNVAFSLLEQIHDGGKRSYREAKDAFLAVFLDRIVREGPQVEEAERIKARFEWDAKEREIVGRSEKRVNVAVYIAYALTVLSFGLLVVLGFNPTAGIPIWCAAVTLALLALPTPVMYFWLKRFWKKALHDLEAQTAIETRVSKLVAQALKHFQPPPRAKKGAKHRGE